MIVRLRIAEIAKQQYMNQKDLAEKSGVSAQVISRYWNNYTRSVALEQFVRIARALHVSVEDLIDVEETFGKAEQHE